MHTAFAAFGCYCRLNGQRCLGNLRCINNNCSCPTGGSFLAGTGGQCIANWWISIGCNNPLTTFGWTDCVPPVQANVPGLIINGSRPIACTTQVLKSFTVPTDIIQYDDTNIPPVNFLAVDPNTGQVYFTGGVPPQATASVPCGPTGDNVNGFNTAANPPPNVPPPAFHPEPIVETYQVQCTDSRGIVAGNTLTFNITWPSCDVTQVCNLDGSCCVAGTK